MEMIAKIYTDFSEKFGIPRQSGLSANLSRIVFEKKYRREAALKGLDGYSHIWIIWQFSELKRKDWTPTVRPPRLGGNRRMGVFATRSPYRPNPIGLSSVKLVKIEKTATEGAVLWVEGADMLNGTLIYDIKPYLSFTDSHPNAVCGFADEALGYTLDVVIPESIKSSLTQEETEELTSLLSQDPRPHYKEDGDAEYGMSFKNKNVNFKVESGIISVTNLQNTNKT